MEPQPKKSRVKSFLKRVRNFLWGELSPALKWGLLALLAISFMFTGTVLTNTLHHYGIGPMLSIWGIVLGACLVFILVATLVLNIFKRMRWQITLVLLLSVILLSTTMLLLFYLIPLAIFTLICVYFSIMLVCGKYAKLGRIKKILRYAAAAFSGIAIVVLAVLIFWPGPYLSPEDRPDFAVLAVPHPYIVPSTTGVLQNPSLPGVYSHNVYFYASGSQRANPFPGETVIESNTADASGFLHGWSGNRRRSLGFEPDALPLNAQVWMPVGEGPFPLALIVHGNHIAGRRSDLGYSYLGEHLASRGIIAASVDQNFLNSSLFYDMIMLSGLDRENAVRGFILLEHVHQWYEWSHDYSHQFYNKVDFESIVLIGHSRGGEAVALAAAFAELGHYPGNGNINFDFPFSINTAIAIAPTHQQYNPAGLEVYLTGVNYLVIHGGYDKDVSSFMGADMFNQVDVSESGIKARVWMKHANHGQFNSVWGGRDLPGILALATNRRAIMSQEEQQQAAKVFISAFLEAALHGRYEYAALFRDFSYGAEWLPPALYYTAFADSSMLLLDSFDIGFDMAASSTGLVTYSAQGFDMWTRGRLPSNFGRNTNRVLMLEFGGEENEYGPPVFRAEFASGVVSAGDVLYMSLSSGNPGDNDSNIYFEIILTDINGNSASRHINDFGGVANPITVNIFSPLASLVSNNREPVLQMVSIPTSEFAGITGEIVSMEWAFEVEDTSQTLYIDDLRARR